MQLDEYTIKPPSGLINLNLLEILRFRDLFYIFIWRDIKVRYKQTILGILWAVFQPFFTTVIFTLFFGKLARVPSDNIPYPVFVYTGLLFWNYFVNALTNTSGCLVDNESIIKKVYFPRLILPLATSLTPAVDFLFALLVMIGLMIYYNYSPNLLGLLSIPILLLFSFLTASGLGLFLAALNARYRDVRYILPFFIQMLLFISPVIYPVSLVPEKYQWLLYLNPMTGIVTLARSIILNSGNYSWSLLGLSGLSCLIIFSFGLIYFKKTERFFADLI